MNSLDRPLIDRVAPSRRPPGRIAGYQRWRSLLFMHWPVDVDILRRLVPPELELDLYENKAYVGVVPFEMEGVRPWWWPESCSMSFLETNLRTYVIYNGRPGIYFFSLEANSRFAVWGARAGWGLPYHYARASVKRTDDATGYETRRPRNGPSHSVRYRVGDEFGPSEPGTLRHFLLERYLLFVERGREMYAGQVHHEPYPAFDATVFEVQDELIAAAGFPAVTAPPAFVHYSPGVDVEVFPLVGVT
ncbi:MAG: DUF2071 domain-containing protein [Planctomycetota bacterium]|nr:DUF2071 domain-containing protein [Planctomycetota bacterium]